MEGLFIWNYVPYRRNGLYCTAAVLMRSAEYDTNLYADIPLLAEDPAPRQDLECGYRGERNLPHL